MLLLLLVACGTSKKTSSEKQYKSQDTAATQVAQHTADSSGRSSVQVIRDSAIGIQGKKVEDSISKEDTEIPVTPKGKKVPRHFAKKENGLTAWVVIDTNGNVRYGAESDSLTLVVKNLVRQSDSLTRIISTKDSSNTRIVHAVQQTSISSTTKVRGFWAANWWWIALAVFCAAAYVAYRLLKKQYTGR